MRHETLITRDNGREIKIVTNVSNSPFVGVSTDTFVQYRDEPNHDWHNCKMKSEFNTKKMSRAEYMERGRPEFLQVVTIGEFLKAAHKARQAVEKPLVEQLMNVC